MAANRSGRSGDADRRANDLIDTFAAALRAITSDGKIPERWHVQLRRALANRSGRKPTRTDRDMEIARLLVQHRRALHAGKPRVSEDRYIRQLAKKYELKEKHIRMIDTRKRAAAVTAELLQLLIDGDRTAAWKLEQWAKRVNRRQRSESPAEIERTDPHPDREQNSD